MQYIVILLHYAAKEERAMCLIPFHFEIFNCRMSDPFSF